MRNECHHLRAMQQGDRNSFQCVYRYYQEIIYRYCLQLLKSPALAEEATVDVFVQLWQSRHRVDTEHTVRPFLYKIARDTAYNSLKKIAREARLRKEFMAHFEPASWQNGEEQLLARERLQAMHQVIDRLPPKRKLIFKMRYYEGKDNKAIAKQLDISSNTVKVHLVKAKHYLRRHLSTS